MYNFNGFNEYNLNYLNEIDNYFENANQKEDDFYQIDSTEKRLPIFNLSEPETKATNYEKRIEINFQTENLYCIQEEKNIEDNEEKGEITTQTFTNKKRGRAKEIGDYEHNRFSDDNLRRKIKHILLNNLLYFINFMIKKIYDNSIGKGIFSLVLLTLNQKQKSNASIQYNQEFLYKSIGDIFSDDISTRYTYYPPYHNKRVVNYLKSDPIAKNTEFFTKIFNLSFLDCLKHFRGSIKIDELKGMKGIEIIKEKYKDDDDYIKSLNYYIMNYEIIINKKKPRHRKKKKNEE